MKKSGRALVVLLLAASTMAFAQPPGGPGMADGMGRKERREQLRDKLHLTDRQEPQVRQLRLDLERKQAQIQSKIRLARIDMKEIHFSEKIDRAALEKSIKQVSDLQHQIKMNHLDFWFSVNGILTTDQQKIWKEHVGEIMGEMRERMSARRHHGGRMMLGPPDDRGPQ